MKAFLESKASLSDTVKLEKAKNNNYLFSIENNSSKLTHAVGVFSHHRDVKVALEELRDTGFPLNWITLIARDCWRYSWSPGLSIYNYCDEGTLSFNQNSQHFFQRLLQRGKYLMLITGKENDVNFAGIIMGRRRSHSKVWHFK